EYGRRMSQHFGRELAMAGVQIISGMARGIDGIAQMAALEPEGYSLGVLGCGVDICYPTENRELYEILCKRGGICSEYPPATEPRNSLFPPRNRIISGLADAVLVIEAKNRSGTLITVDMALEQGREVYALPGRATDALSEGCNRLIQQGANVALSAADMLRGLTGQENGDFVTIGCAGSQSLLSDIQKELLQVLEDTPQSPEMIREQMLFKSGTEVTLSGLMNQLVKLSLMGYARQIGNSYFVKA
ncbi:MAG: DNA-protecting protein DprA, partial [Lachnospiraceae bacterium]|nr:DNA-protecting protein DprA [Lachnospiraceae bacterium]